MLLEFPGINNLISSARRPSLELESETSLGLPSLCSNTHGLPASETGKGTHAPSDGSLISLFWFLDTLALSQQPAFTFMAFPDYLSRGEACFPFVLSLLQLCMALSSEPKAHCCLGSPSIYCQRCKGKTQSGGSSPMQIFTSGSPVWTIFLRSFEQVHPKQLNY